MKTAPRGFFLPLYSSMTASASRVLRVSRRAVTPDSSAARKNISLSPGDSSGSRVFHKSNTLSSALDGSAGRSWFCSRRYALASRTARAGWSVMNVEAMDAEVSSGLRLSLPSFACSACSFAASAASEAPAASGVPAGSAASGRPWASLSSRSLRWPCSSRRYPSYSSGIRTSPPPSEDCSLRASMPARYFFSASRSASVVPESPEEGTPVRFKATRASMFAAVRRWSVTGVKVSSSVRVERNTAPALSRRDEGTNAFISPASGLASADAASSSPAPP